MTKGAQVRGQPLVALLAILTGWAGGRLATWEPPALIQGAVASEQVGSYSQAGRPSYSGLDVVVGPQSLPGSGSGFPGAGLPGSDGTAGYAGVPTSPRRVEYLTGNPAARWLAPPSFAVAPESFSPEPFRREAEFSALPSLSSLFALSAQPSPPTTVGPGAVPVVHRETRGAKRWSVDAWAMMRRGAGELASGSLPATYGASQAGAVLRYRIATRSGYRPAAYLRTTSTLGQLPETSAALGLSARPLSKFPVIAAIEARLTDQAGTRRFQPALMAVTEIPPFELPMEMSGEAYAQAGYVAGKFATPFADGQFRFDRSLYRVGAIEARLGGGIWGGVQKGAGRLDLGPSAAVSLPLGRKMYGRAAFDWRFRVIGNASPQSGPAVTLSAGF